MLHQKIILLPEAIATNICEQRLLLTTTRRVRGIVAESLTGNIAYTEKTILVPLETELQDPVTFDYTGAEQTWTVPDGVTSVSVDAYGASDWCSIQGWSNPGKGGKVETTLSVIPSEVIKYLCWRIWPNGKSSWL